MTETRQVTFAADFDAEDEERELDAALAHARSMPSELWDTFEAEVEEL